MRRADRLGFWLFLALAAALRLWTITGKNLWLDESTSWDLAKSSVSRLMSWTASDIHPPLYYLILKCWVGLFGDSLVALRMLSAVASLIAFWLFYELIHDVTPRVVVYVALFWFAISPHAIYYAQETRMYAPVTAAVLGACLAYRRWVDSGFTRRSMLVAYACCAAASIYLHYFTALAMAAIWVHFLIVRRADLQVRQGPGLKARPTYVWLVAHVAVGIAYLPWITTAIAQITRGQSWRQPVTVGQIPDYTKELLRMLTFGMYNVPYLDTMRARLAVGVLAIGVVSALVAAFRAKGERDAFFASMAIVPIALGLALLPRSGHMDLSRYLPYAVPLAIAAAARGMSRLPLRPAYAAALMLAGTLGVFPSLRAYYQDPVKDSDARPIVAYLLEHARHTNGQPQDPIYVAPEFMTTMVAFISRQDLGYRKADVSNQAQLEQFTPEPGKTTWVIVDYRLTGFGELAGQGRLEPVDVPNGRPERMRLFRLTTK